MLIATQLLTKTLQMVEAQTLPQTQEPFPTLNFALSPGDIGIALIGAQALLHHCHRAQTTQCPVFAASVGDVDRGIQLTSSPNNLDLHTILPLEYHDLVNVFSRNDANKLSPYRPYDHKIIL